MTTHLRSSLAVPASHPSSAPAALDTRTPLGAARTIRPSHSNGQLAREFQDKHSTTYAHLYLGESDDAVLREKLDREAKAVEVERVAARERRDAYLRSIGNVGSANKGEGEKENTERRTAWRPLSLVAKRQAALGHARSASAAAAPQDKKVQGIRSVSHTPSSSIGGMRHQAIEKARASRDASPLNIQRPTSSSVPAPDLEVVIEGDHQHEDRMEEMRSVSSRDSATSNRYRPTSYPSDTGRDTSTYSWATSFSGETSELRAAAQYVGSDDHGSTDSIPSRDPDRSETPPKIKQRRKRIVTLAHTVRQLEGVGSREPEDPDFYEKLVKAWNERPGVVPVPRPSILKKEDRMEALTDAPPVFGYAATPAMTEPSPAMAQSPDELYTPAMPHTVHNQDRMSRVTRSTRFSYASTLHDLALEVQGDRLMADKPWMREGGYSEDQLQGTSRFGGLSDFDMPPPLHSAFSPETPLPVPLRSTPPPPGSSNRNSFDKLQAGIATSDWLRPSLAHTAASTPTRPLRRVEGQVLRYGDEPPPLPPRPEESAWGLGFMSTWWNDRQTSTPTDEQDFQIGKDGDRSSRRTEMDWKSWTRGTSCGADETEQPDTAVPASGPRVLVHGRKRPRGSSWSSGAPSFPIGPAGTVEWLGSRAQTPVNQARLSQPSPYPVSSDSSFSATYPRVMTGVHQRAYSTELPTRIDFTRTPSDLHPPVPIDGVTPSTSAATTEGEREFPFSNLCRRPSSSTHSHTSLHMVPLCEERPAFARQDSRQQQVQRAAELGLGPPPLSAIRWMQEPVHATSETDGSRGLESLSSLFPAVPGAVSVRPRLSSRPLLSTLRHQPSLTIKVPGESNGRKTARRKSVSPVKVHDADADMRIPVRDLLAPAPPSSGASGLSHETLLLPPPATPAESSYSVYLGIPLSPLPTPPLPKATDTTIPSVWKKSSTRPRPPSLTPFEPAGPVWQPPTRLPIRPMEQSSEGSSSPIESVDGGNTLYNPARPPRAAKEDGAFRPGGVRVERAAGDVAIAVAQTKPKLSRLPVTFFWLGCIMPWFWLIAGWGLSSRVQVQDEEKAVGGVASTLPPAPPVRSWLYHPDPWCRRSRIAAATILPSVAVAAVVGVVVLAVLR